MDGNATNGFYLQIRWSFFHPLGIFYSLRLKGYAYEGFSSVRLKIRRRL